MAVYACSDLHGNWELWLAIKKFLKPEDKMFFLGDAADRGDSGWAILKEMLNDKRITYIAGNHDIMLADRIGNPNSYRIASLHHSNGGFPTWEAAENDPEAKEIMVKIRRLPKYAVYENADGLKIFMSHSGSTNIDNDEDLIWDRDHFLDPWPEDEIFQKAIIVHGHTPIPYLLEEIDPACRMGDIEAGALWYADGKKCCIDCGAVFTGYCVLLNLDTWDEEVFCSDPYLS